MGKPKVKNQRWRMTSKGATKYYRACDHQAERAGETGTQEDLATVPEWVDEAGDMVYCQPKLADFYEDKPPELAARVCYCLMQLMIFYTRGWEPDHTIATKCGGHGFGTTSRRAVMWHHVDVLDEQSQNHIVSSDLRLIGQALKDKPFDAIVAKYRVPESGASENPTASSSGSAPPPIANLTNILLAIFVQAVQLGDLPWPKCFKDETTAWNQYDGVAWQV